MLKYKDFKIIEPTDAVCEKIDRLVVDHRGSVFHESFLNKLFAKVFLTRFSYLVDDPDDIKFAAPVHIRRISAGVKQYIIGKLFDIPYSGFIGKGDINFSGLKVGFFESLSYAGFPDRFKQNLIYGSSGFGETAMVDLSPDENTIFNTSIRSARRNMIRKARNNGVEVKIYFNEEGFSIFIPMLQQLHNYLGDNDFKADFYRELFTHYSVRCQAFIGIAFRKNEPVSGLLAIGNGHCMHYYKGASLTGVENDGHGELLQWEAIRTSRNLGTSMYDLCNLNKNELPDIYRFKTGFSRDIYTYPRHSYSATGYKVLNRISNLLSS